MAKRRNELFRQHRPDVALMDLRRPIMKGVEANAAIRSEFPRGKIVVFRGSGADEDRALRPGVRSYLWKSMSTERLFKAIRIVHSGGRSMPGPVASILSERILGKNIQHRCSARQLSAWVMEDEVHNLVPGYNAEKLCRTGQST